MSGAAAEAYMAKAERECAIVPGLTVEPGPLNVVGIVGAGTMGGRIAMCYNMLRRGGHARGLLGH